MKNLIFLLCVFLTGCTTAVAPQGMKIKTTQNPTDVENCTVVGSVEAHPPYMWPGDDFKQLKNKAILLGADTVFVTSRYASIFGLAYVCNQSAVPIKVSSKSSEKQLGMYSELINLKELLDKGIITQEEFTQQKSKVLNQ